jgi:hypothetical protein
MYIGIHLMSTALALSKGLTPFHIILTNPNFPLGGLSAASKTEVLDHFKRTDQYLPQVLISKDLPLEKRRQTAEEFIQRSLCRWWPNRTAGWWASGCAGLTRLKN